MDEFVDELVAWDPAWLRPGRPIGVAPELGDTEMAFELLEKAYQDKNEWLGWLNTDPRLDRLRPDPRFESLLRRVGHIPQDKYSASTETRQNIEET